MSIKRRGLSTLLALLLCVSLLPVGTLASEEAQEPAAEQAPAFLTEETEAPDAFEAPEPVETAEAEPALDGLPISGTICGGDITWTLSADYVLTISGRGAVDEGWGYDDPVWRAFRDCVKEIVIEEGITELGRNAFVGLHAATRLKLPESLRAIGSNAFESCWSLESLELPDALESLGEEAFYLCESLASVKIGNGLSEIPASAFRRCTELVTVTIPTSVTVIGEKAFLECAALATVDYAGTDAQWDAIDIAEEGNGALLFARSGGAGGTLSTGLTWRMDGDGTLTISGSGAMPDFDYIYAMPWDTTHITAVVVEEGVTGIGGLAFYGAHSLEDVRLPDSLKSIGRSAFDECIALKQITIPDDVTTIGGYAFSGCEALESITLPKALAEADDSVFNRCNAVKKVVYAGTEEQWDSFELPWVMKLAWLGQVTGTCGDGMTWVLTADRVLTISGSGTVENEITPQSDGWSFDRESVEKVVLTPGVTGIGAKAFNSFNGMKEISIPDSVSTIGEAAFSSCAALETIVIPSGVTALPSDESYYSSSRGMFSGCESLKSIELPASVKEIGEYAFKGCTALSEIRYGGTQAQWEAIELGEGNELASLLVLGAISGSAGEQATWTLTKDGVLTISGTGDTDFESLSRYGTAAWLPENIPVSVVVEAGITSIDTGMCYGLTNLKDVQIADTVKSIGESAFKGCTSLESVVIPASVEAIYGSWNSESANGVKGAFTNCTSLLEVIFEEGSRLTTLGACAFQGCTGLTQIAIPAGVREIGAYAFGESWLRSIVLPEGLETIGQYAFYKTRLAHVEIPDSVKTIGRLAFYEIQSSSFSVVWPKGATVMEDNMFSGSRLEGIELPDEVEEIGYNSFFKCSWLREIELPENTKNIGMNAFASSDVRKIYIPAGLERVYYAAFDDTRLEDVYYGGTEAQWAALTIDEKNEPLLNADIHYEADGFPVDPSSIISVIQLSGDIDLVIGEPLRMEFYVDLMSVKDAYWTNLEDGSVLREGDIVSAGTYALTVTLSLPRGFSFADEFDQFLFVYFPDTENEFWFNATPLVESAEVSGPNNEFVTIKSYLIEEAHEDLPLDADEDGEVTLPDAAVFLATEQPDAYKAAQVLQLIVTME